MNKIRGFSLIELMIVVGVLGVIMAIALPIYRDYQRRAMRSAAGTVLLEIVSKQEQYAASNRLYATSLVELSVVPPGEVSAAYNFSLAQVQWISGTITMTGFTATATPVGGGAMEDDHILAINQFGLRTPVGVW